MEPIDYLVAKESHDLLALAIHNLPETERLILRMCDIEGFHPNETAGCLKLPTAKVRRALTRARELLKARLA